MSALPVKRIQEAHILEALNHLETSLELEQDLTGENIHFRIQSQRLYSTTFKNKFSHLKISRIARHKHTVKSNILFNVR